uniref:Putative secreted protein n=1 Tax=Anopheles triannulatus TaxID=58253 RepID=A0A2M4B4V4_9DIPT
MRAISGLCLHAPTAPASTWSTDEQITMLASQPAICEKLPATISLPGVTGRWRYFRCIMVGLSNLAPLKSVYASVALGVGYS